MANYKAKDSVLRRLSCEDRAALLSIYLHRCLNEDLLYTFFYSGIDPRRSHTSFRVRDLIIQRLLQPVDYGGESPALFLTTAGVETVKAIFGSELSGYYRDGRSDKLPRASDLRIKEQNIRHQMSLNSFVLRFKSYADGHVPYRYFDEKFMPKASSSMMPDGLVELPDCFLFLEMDMGTESPHYLKKKWESYRSFLCSPNPIYREKPVIMLFILSGVTNTALRIKNVARTIMSCIGSYVDGRFEVYINAPDALHEIVRAGLLRQGAAPPDDPETLALLERKHGFIPSTPSFLSQQSYPFGFYIRRRDEQGRVEVRAGRPQEFIADIWLNGRVSVLRNLMYIDQASREIHSATNRALPYLIVAPSEKAAADALDAVNSVQPRSVFFTTPSRLSTCEWPKALFQIDQLGNLSHFTDDALLLPVHERRTPRSC